MKVVGGVAPRVHLGALDAEVTPLTAEELLRRLGPASRLSKTYIIANHNLHSLYLNLTDPLFRDFYRRANVVLIDGFPVLMAARRVVRKGTSAVQLTATHRIGSLDWIQRLDEASDIRRVALIGASSESNGTAVERLGRLHPSIQYEGWDGESWSDEKAKAICEKVSFFQPDVIFVGLGMPLQERFISDCTAALPKVVIATIGGAIDQISGSQSAAPRWLGRVGLEWLWRLVSHPKRLGYRYLVEPWKLFVLVVRRHLNEGKVE